MYFQFFGSFDFSFFSILESSTYKSYTCFVRFILNMWVFPQFLFPNFQLLICRSTIDFCLLTRCPPALVTMCLGHFSCGEMEFLFSPLNPERLGSNTAAQAESPSPCPLKLRFAHLLPPPPSLPNSHLCCPPWQAFCITLHLLMASRIHFPTFLTQKKREEQG